jgi:hypothetical protein
MPIIKFEYYLGCVRTRQRLRRQQWGQSHNVDSELSWPRRWGKATATPKVLMISLMRSHIISSSPSSATIRVANETKLTGPLPIWQNLRGMLQMYYPWFFIHPLREACLSTKLNIWFFFDRQHCQPAYWNTEISRLNPLRNYTVQKTLIYLFFNNMLLIVLLQETYPSLWGKRCIHVVAPCKTNNTS